MTADLVDEELLKALGRSELLGVLRPYLDNPGIRSILGEFLQFHVVVDSNVIYSDLYFVLCVRQKSEVKPTVKELLSSKTIIGYFPQEMLPEMHAKCLELSARYELQPEEVLEQWRQYQTLLRIVPTAHIGNDLPELKELRDLTDTALLKARRAVGAEAVLTRDKDISAASVPVMPKARVLLDLRDYARNRAVRVAVVIGTSTAVIVPLAAIAGVIRLLYLLCQRASRGVLIALGIAGLFALFHPKSREVLVNAAKSTLRILEDCAEVLGPVFAQAMQTAQHADARAETLRVGIQKELGHLKNEKRTLEQAVYRVCSVAPVPLTLTEVCLAIRATGPEIEGSTVEETVATALRQHPLLTHLPDDRWDVRGRDRSR